MIGQVSDKKDPDGREVFRSPGAILIWWVWALFAAGNLIDIAIQGRDHLSLVAAFALLFVTGIVYVTAKRPRIVADTDGLTIVNPVRDHRVGWAAVAGADPTDLLRIRCEWPDGDHTGRQAIYSWAVHTSRRRQFNAELRARRQQQRGGRAGGGIFGGGASGFNLAGLGAGFAGPAAPAPENDPIRLDADKIVATLTGRAEQARLEAPGDQASRPVATWDWPAVAAVVIPGLALLIAALA